MFLNVSTKNATRVINTDFIVSMTAISDTILEIVLSVGEPVKIVCNSPEDLMDKLLQDVENSGCLTDISDSIDHLNRCLSNDGLHIEICN